MKLPRLKRYKKGGRWYAYHRPTGTRLEPPHEFGSPEFFEAYAAAERKFAKRRVRQQTSAPTLGDLIVSYRRSQAFADLRERTRSDYQDKLDWLSQFGDAPLSDIDGPVVVKLRDKACRERKFRFANYVLSVLSVLFGHGIEQGLASSNPVRGVKKIKRPVRAPVANRAWSAEEKAVVLATAPDHLRLPIAIARYTGLRRGDVIGLKPSNYAKGVIRLITSKRSVALELPCPEPLRKLLDEAKSRNQLRLCLNSEGRPWTVNGFTSSFFKFIHSLEQRGMVGPNLTFHGLRTSRGEELESFGFNARQIADVLGQRSAASAEHYTRNADRSKSARLAAELLDGTGEAQKLSTDLSTRTNSG